MFIKIPSQLTASAQDWARQLAASCRFDHRPTHEWPSSARNENIASRCEWYPPGSDPVFDNWKNSYGHNKAVSWFWEILCEWIAALRCWRTATALWEWALRRRRAAVSGAGLQATRQSRTELFSLPCMAEKLWICVSWYRTLGTFPYNINNINNVWTFCAT